MESTKSVLGWLWHTGVVISQISSFKYAAAIPKQQPKSWATLCYLLGFPIANAVATLFFTAVGKRSYPARAFLAFVMISFQLIDLIEELWKDAISMPEFFDRLLELGWIMAAAVLFCGSIFDYFINLFEKSAVDEALYKAGVKIQAKEVAPADDAVKVPSVSQASSVDAMPPRPRRHSQI